MKKFLSILTMLTVLTVPTQAFADTRSFPDPTFGKSTAPVKMVIFSDFQCPYCANFHETLNSKEIHLLTLHGKLQITFKDFPLSFHTNATAATQAVNAVLSISPTKGKRMMDLVFNGQKDWAEKKYVLETFVAYAKKLGIDAVDFLKAFHDPANIAEIQSDYKEGLDKKIEGTPSYFINGKPYTGAVDLEELLKELKS